MSAPEGQWDKGTQRRNRSEQANNSFQKEEKDDNQTVLNLEKKETAIPISNCRWRRPWISPE